MSAAVSEFVKIDPIALDPLLFDEYALSVRDAADARVLLGHVLRVRRASQTRASAQRLHTGAAASAVQKLRVR